MDHLLKLHTNLVEYAKKSGDRMLQMLASELQQAGVEAAKQVEEELQRFANASPVDLT